MMQLTDEKVHETDRMKIEYERNVKRYQKDKCHKNKANYPKDL
jgi:hypothetical protein